MRRTNHERVSAGNIEDTDVPNVPPELAVFDTCVCQSPWWNKRSVLVAYPKCTLHSKRRLPTKGLILGQR